MSKADLNSFIISNIYKDLYTVTLVLRPQRSLSLYSFQLNNVKVFLIRETH